MGMGIGWKSLQALILRAPLCGANNLIIQKQKYDNIDTDKDDVDDDCTWDGVRILLPVKTTAPS